MDGWCTVGAGQRLGILLDTLEREREPTAFAVDLEHQDVDGIPLRDDLTGILDVMCRKLRNVDETLDPRQDLDEGAEGDHLRDATLDDVPLAVVVEHLLPRIGLCLLQPERDALTLAIDVEHLHLDRLSDLEHFRRMVHVRPRKLGDVDQPVHPVEVDEGAEVDDVRDRPLDDVARAQSVEDRLAHLLALVLEHGAPRKDDVVARAIQLDHLAAELLAQELVEVLHPADVDKRRGQEPAHAEVEDETALDDLDHTAVDRLAARLGTLDRLPGELEPGALLREDETPFGILLRHHERVDLLADRNLVGRVDAAPDRQLCDGDDALGLVADVDEHLVLVDAHDGAVHHLSLVDRRESAVVVGDELAVGAGRPDAVHDSGGCLDGRSRLLYGVVCHLEGGV